MLRRLLIFALLLCPSSAWAESFTPDANCTLPTSLMAYFKLDEASGTRVDSKSTNDLTDNNTVTQAVGKVANAAQFTSANSEYLSIGDTLDLSTGDIDFTISGWVYPDSHPGAGADRYVVAKGDIGDSATAEYFVALRRDGGDTQTTLVLGVRATTVGTTVLSTATWYFFVAWHDSVNNQLGIQVNGGTVETVAFSTGSPDTACSFTIGVGNPSGTGCGGTVAGFLNGRTDEVGFSKKVFTAQERTDLYNGGSGNTYDAAGTCTMSRVMLIATLLPVREKPRGGPGSIGRALAHCGDFRWN